MHFATQQKTVTIGNVTLGGQPGEYPTVLVGSMFYKGHKIFTEPGIFNQEEATSQLQAMESIARETGMSFIIDVVGDSADNLVNYCQFVADATESKQQPFLMDGLTDDIRVPAMKRLVESGLGDRLVYNSIEPKILDDTINAIAECGIKSAILLSFDSTMLLPQQKLKLLEGWDDKAGVKEGLMAKAGRAGVENCIVDVAVLDMPSIGLAARAIETVKETLGLPAGCAPSNAIFECSGIKRFGEDARLTSLVAASTFLAASGADFILFGPIKYCKDVCFAVANVDAFHAYAGRRIDKIKPASEDHPLFKLF
ncbi:MAG TPA: tetrahydromethanopterin S-methyltransferase subunit H [Candidatus Lokiarchaeia archaeon]|nr:tetrahydromethanopterin S-methyltransferase subunit H [Candidatus Lokiarchaeia archaeon]